MLLPSGISIEAVLYLGAIGLIVIGLFGMLIINNVFRILLSLVIFEAGANLLLVLSSYKQGAIAPVFIDASSNQALMTDPVPQALVLTAIVIGVGIQALALALIFKVKDNYQTLDMRKIRYYLESDIAQSVNITTSASSDKPVQSQRENQMRTHGVSHE